jgi:hypothetical protein
MYTGQPGEMKGEREGGRGREREGEGGRGRDMEGEGGTGREGEGKKKREREREVCAVWRGFVCVCVSQRHRHRHTYRHIYRHIYRHRHRPSLKHRHIYRHRHRHRDLGRRREDEARERLVASRFCVSSAKPIREQ